MQKVLAMLAVTLSSFSLAAQASDETEMPKNEIEVRGFFRGGAAVRGYFEKTLTDKVSLNLSVFKAHGWNEATVGPTYYITPEMSVGAGFGALRHIANDESTKSSHRMASFFWFWKTDTWEAEILAERYHHDPKPWYQEGYAQKHINNNWAAGIFVAKDSGWGPRLSYSVHENINVWMSPLVKKFGDTTAILGVVVSF